MKVHVSGLTSPIAPEDWGRDHKTTLMYAECRAVDHQGVLPCNDPRMRKDGDQYPSFIRDGIEVVGHNDYDCLRDAEAAGFNAHIPAVMMAYELLNREYRKKDRNSTDESLAKQVAESPVLSVKREEEISGVHVLTSETKPVMFIPA